MNQTSKNKVDSTRKCDDYDTKGQSQHYLQEGAEQLGQSSALPNVNLERLTK